MANVGVIYIGTFLSADTDEGNWTNENDGVFAGTHGKTALRSLRIDVTTPQGDGVAYDDDLGQSASQITYDLGGGPVTALQDSVASYTVDILLGVGSNEFQGFRGRHVPGGRIETDAGAVAPTGAEPVVFHHGPKPSVKNFSDYTIAV